ncbi:hypothetical protein BDZ89DRAFT_1152635 [Hymenopellis radicata]|nr:hypothetical protein BDZ89DRAFT_1152635 [Hymenopellis radicata]
MTPNLTPGSASAGKDTSSLMLASPPISSIPSTSGTTVLPSPDAPASAVSIASSTPTRKRTVSLQEEETERQAESQVWIRSSRWKGIQATCGQVAEVPQVSESYLPTVAMEPVPIAWLFDDISGISGTLGIVVQLSISIIIAYYLSHSSRTVTTSIYTLF